MIRPIVVISDKKFNLCVLLYMQRMGAYTSTKAAMLNMMKNLAPELHEMNIRVNCIAPGLFPTKLGDGVSYYYNNPLPANHDKSRSQSVLLAQ